MNREELTDFLKEVLHACGESISIDIVWLEKIKTTSGLEEEYQLLIKSDVDLQKQDCIKPIIDKYGLKLARQGFFWVLSEKTN